MKTERIFVFSLLITLTAFCSGPVLALDEDPGPAEIQEAMVNALYSIEEVAGLEPEASQAMAELDYKVVELLFSSLQYKSEFVASAEQVVDRIQRAQDAMPDMPDFSASKAFSPNYPTGASYSVALLFGLVDSPDDRCGGEAFEVYEAVLAGAEAAMAIGEAACSVGGCDPTGIGCAIVCGAVEVVKLAVLTARIPLDACAAHSVGVDSAEIEADFENGLSILGSLDSQNDAIEEIANALADHDANIDGDLAAHDARIRTQLNTHDSEIKAMIQDVLTNQEEIIKMMKTPEGRIPGWKKEGY